MPENEEKPAGKKPIGIIVFMVVMAIILFCLLCVFLSSGFWQVCLALVFHCLDQLYEPDTSVHLHVTDTHLISSPDDILRCSTGYVKLCNAVCDCFSAICLCCGSGPAPTAAAAPLSKPREDDVPRIPMGIDARVRERRNRCRVDKSDATISVLSSHPTVRVIRRGTELSARASSIHPRIRCGRRRRKSGPPFAVGRVD